MNEEKEKQELQATIERLREKLNRLKNENKELKRMLTQ